MLRPSAIIAWIAGTPSAVAGIFTKRLGSSIRSCSRRAATTVASVSRASSGATSTDTKPSVRVRVVDRAQDGEGGGDVGDDQLPVGVLDRAAGRRQRGELLVVVGRALDGPGEDGRVGGDAADPVGDQAGQGAVAQVAAGEVVEPRALALLGVQLVQLAHRASFRTGAGGPSAPVDGPRLVG